MIRIKTKEEIALIREGGKILAQVLDEVIKDAKPGAETEDLENKACDLIEKAGGRPAFKNHPMSNGELFPTALCVSVNNEIVHVPAIPSRELKEGDIVGIDIGMEYPAYAKASAGKPVNKYSKLGGYYTDMSKTVAIGKINDKAQKLVNTTKECLDIAIKKVKPGVSINDIGKAVQNHAESRGFSVVRELVGHGVGHDVHEDPQVPNYDVKDKSVKNAILKSGMVIAIEPMLNIGDWRIEVADDGMSIITKDGSLSAHFEHTIAVTDDGYEVLTKR
jgi:methionyl aminopeptidase